jgi:hypothetical protein
VTHDPLDDIERALVRALIPIIGDRIRQQLAEEDEAARKTERPAAS